MTRNLRNKHFFYEKKKSFLWMHVCVCVLVCGGFIFVFYFNFAISQHSKLKVETINNADTNWFFLFHLSNDEKKNIFILIYSVKIGYICTFVLLTLLFYFIFFFYSFIVLFVFFCCCCFHWFIRWRRWLHAFSNRISINGDEKKPTFYTTKFISLLHIYY